MFPNTHFSTYSKHMRETHFSHVTNVLANDCEWKLEHLFWYSAFNCQREILQYPLPLHQELKKF